MGGLYTCLVSIHGRAVYIGGLYTWVVCIDRWSVKYYHNGLAFNNLLSR